MKKSSPNILRKLRKNKNIQADELELLNCIKKSSSELKGTGEFLNTDLMFELDYSDSTGWKAPKISGYQKLEIYQEIQSYIVQCKHQMEFQLEEASAIRIK